MAKEKTTLDAYEGMSISPKQATQSLNYFYKAKVPVIFHGQPGVGKTEIIQQFADNVNMPLWKVIPAEEDVVSLFCPSVYKDNKGVHKSVLAPSDRLPTEPCIVLIDDITNTPDALQATLYSLLRTYSFGSGAYTLPEGSYVCAAGNRPKDNCNAYELSAAIKTRVQHLNINPPTMQDWWDGFGKDNVKSSLLAGFCHSPDVQDVFQIGFDGNNPTGGCTPRSFFNLDSILQEEHDGEYIYETPLFESVVKGAVGEKIGHKIIEFSEEYKNQISYDEILSGKGKAHHFPEHGSFVSAVAKRRPEGEGDINF